LIIRNLLTTVCDDMKLLNGVHDSLIDQQSRSCSRMVVDLGNVRGLQWEKGWRDYADTLSLKILPSRLVIPTSTHLSVSPR